MGHARRRMATAVSMVGLVLGLMLGWAVEAHAQHTWSDDFADGDFTANPAWTGTTDRWTIAPLNGQPALRTDGVAAADTLYLATASPVSFGSWAFTFAQVDVNLSIFNGARVFLLADTDVLDGPVRGYYLQMGTNNSNEVRLYRMDGDPRTARTELGRSAPILDGTDNQLALAVTRDPDGTWEVRIDGTLAFTATDDTYAFSQHFGVWAKHTASAPANLYFDDFVVSGATGPVSPDPLTVRGAEQVAERVAELALSAPVDLRPLAPGDVRLDDGTPAVAIDAMDDGRLLRLSFDEPLRGATLAIDRLRDFAGRELTDVQVPLAHWPAPGELLLNEIMYNPRVDRFDPTPDQPSYVELVNTSPHVISLRHLRWAGLEDVHGMADTLHVGQPFTPVQPGGYVVIAAEPNAAPDEIPSTRLYQAFPDFPWGVPNVTLLTLSRSTLGLRNSGDRIELFGSGPEAIDAVTYAPSWHHPGVQQTAGRALERLHLHRATNDARNWTTSVAADGGTPGRRNSVFLEDPRPLTAEALAVRPSPFFPEGQGSERFAVIQFQLRSPVSSVRVRIYDTAGRLVRTLEEARLVAQTGELLWDGRGDRGQRLRMGPYIVHLEAVDEAEGRIETHRAPVVLARPM